MRPWSEHCLLPLLGEEGAKLFQQGEKKRFLLPIRIKYFFITYPVWQLNPTMLHFILVFILSWLSILHNLYKNLVYHINKWSNK